MQSVCSGSRCPLGGPALETSWNSSGHRRQGSVRLLPRATECSLSVALGQVEMWRIVMGPQEGLEHTAADSEPASQQFHARDTRLSEQPGHQGKEAWMASLLRSQACRRKDFIRRDIARPHARRAGSSLCRLAPQLSSLIFSVHTRIPANNTLLHFQKCLSLDWAWWCTCVTQLFWKQRQKDHKSKASLSNLDPVSKKGG